MRINTCSSRRSLHWLAMGGVLAVLVALTGVLASHDTAFAAFSPTASICLDNAATKPLPDVADCDGDTAPGAHADIALALKIDKPDPNFGGIVNFAPPQWKITDGKDIPVGAFSAQLAAIAQLGLIGGACANILSVNFDMLNGTLDTSTLIPFKDPNVDQPSNGDQDDQFDVGPDGLPLGVSRYPDYLTRIFPGLDPISRIYGQTIVGGIDVSVQLVTFAPGTEFPALSNRPKAFAADPAMGYLSITLLQSLGDPELDPTPAGANAINDFCTPLLTNFTRFGVSRDNPDTTANEAGTALLTNPSAAGTYNFTNFFASQRDADGDGIENGLDPCAQDAGNAAPNWDPRATIPFAPDPSYKGDNDLDRLPNVCDPFPDQQSAISGGVHDEDQDKYGNRADNCPLNANGIDSGGTLIGPNNQKDSDSDGVGDVCDPNPNDADAQGLSTQICLQSAVTVGAGGTASPAEPNVCSSSGVGIDSNGNGVYDSLEGPNAAADEDGDGVPDTTDRCPGTAAGATVDQFGCTAEQAVLDADKDGVLNAADKCPGTAAGASVNADGCSAAQLAQNQDGGPDVPTGVGSLAPAASSIPAWAAIASGLGGAGFLGTLTAIASRIFGIRLPGRRRR